MKKRFNNDDKRAFWLEKRDDKEKIKELKKLKRLKSYLNGINGIKDEDEYYKQFKIYTEKDKVKFEAKYVKTKLIREKDKYIENENYEDYLQDVNIILKEIENNENIKNSVLRIYKMRLIQIETDLDKDVHLFSEIGSVDEMKVKSNKKEKGM